jgi:hypothetical protein
MCLLSEWFPPTWTASSPDPVTAWMAVAGSGLLPRKATLEAPTLPASRRQRRLPRSRTRPSAPLSENTTVHVRVSASHGHTCLLLPRRSPRPGPRDCPTLLQRISAREHADWRGTPAAATLARRSSRARRPWRSRRLRSWIAQSHSAAAPNAGRRESDHAPDAGAATISVIQMSPKESRAPSRARMKAVAPESAAQFAKQSLDTVRRLRCSQASACARKRAQPVRIAGAPGSVRPAREPITSLTSL